MTCDLYMANKDIIFEVCFRVDVQWLQQLTIILVLVLTFICSSFYKSEYFDSIFWSEILQTLLCKELFLFQCFTKGNFLLEHFE